MISTKNLTPYLALFLAFFTLYAIASPIIGASDSVGVLGNELIRRGSCSTPGCNEQLVLNALVDLKTKVDIKILLLNGHNDPVAICTDIAVYIKAAIQVILAIDINVSGSLGPLIGEIVVVLVAILNGIIGGCSHYSLITIVLELVGIIDAVLADLVHACCSCCPGLLALITQNVLNVTWNLLGFLLTYLACGLGL